ncbi:hypothetical protein [Streptomyces sp. NPDC005046]
MMFTYAEMWPCTPTSLTRGQDPFELPSSDGDSTLAGRLKRLYAERARSYEKELESLIRFRSSTVAGGSSRSPEVLMPKSTADSDEIYALVLDRGLYRQLFDLYAMGGWRAVAAAAELVNTKARTEDPLWELASKFFRFTENVLYLLIREALIEIERLAAERITLQLSQASIELTKAWKRFDFHRIEVDLPVGDFGYVKGKFWQIRDRKFADALFKAMKEAYHARLAADRLAAGKSGPQGVVSICDTLYQQMRAVIDLNAPLALLALQGMTEKTKQRDLEHDFGRLLKELFDRADRLGAGIDSTKGTARWMLPTGPPGSDPHSLPTVVGEVEHVLPPRLGPEGRLIQLALDELDDTPRGARWFPLVCESVLDTLVEDRTIRRDSFAYVVRNNYVLELSPQLAERYESSKGWTKFWNGFSKAAAGLSLILLATPAAEVSPLLRGIAAAGDLILLAYTVHSTVVQLALLNETLSSALMAPGALALPALARLGELRAYRREFVDSIHESLLLAVLQLGPGRWAEVKPLLLAYGYYGDLCTLFGV